MWGGSISDHMTVVESGLLQRLEQGDGIMLDKDFKLKYALPVCKRKFLHFEGMESHMETWRIISCTPSEWQVLV